MNKQELIAKLEGKTKQPITHADLERVVNGVFEEIKNAVAGGDNVAIVGFGTFGTRARAARTGHNPQTGETIQIPACKAPGFKAGKAFKDAVNK